MHGSFIYFSWQNGADRAFGQRFLHIQAQSPPTILSQKPSGAEATGTYTTLPWICRDSSSQSRCTRRVTDSAAAGATPLFSLHRRPSVIWGRNSRSSNENPCFISIVPSLPASAAASGQAPVRYQSRSCPFPGIHPYVSNNTKKGGVFCAAVRRIDLSSAQRSAGTSPRNCRVMWRFSGGENRPPSIVVRNRFCHCMIPCFSRSAGISA